MIFYFIGICRYGSFKNSFATINSLSEHYFRFRGFILLVQIKKVISMSYGSSTRSWKLWRWVRLDLMLTMRDVYINSVLKPLTIFASSSRSIEFKDILPWNISQMIAKTIPISTRIVMRWNGASPFEFDGKSMGAETTTWSEFPNGEKPL